MTLKVRLEKDSGRIFLPDDFAVLEKINADGSFVYKFKYNANVKKLMRGGSKRRAIQVNINVVQNIVFERTVRVFDKGFDPVDILRRLKGRHGLQRQLNRRRRALRLQQRRSDISKKIPNDKTRDLVRQETRRSGQSRGRDRSRSSRQDKNETLGLSQRFEARARSTESLNVSSRVAPILELNLNKFDSNQDLLPSSKKIRTESLRLLHLHLSDPASWTGRRTRSVFPAMKQHGGITSKSSFFYRNQRDPHIKQRIDTLVRSYLTKNVFAEHIQAPGQKFVTVVEKIKDDVARITETVIIQPDVLTTDSFIIEFELTNHKGLVVQRLSAAVKHSRNVALLQRPVLAPFMSVSPIGAKGRNLIELKQLDENASKVVIYRKEIQTSRYNLTEDFEKLQTVDLENDDGEVFTEDTSISNNPVIYRAIPVGVNGELGAEFTSVVIKGQHVKTGTLENRLRRPCYLTLYNEIKETTMALYVDNLPSEPISLELHRRDMSIKGAFQLVDTVYLESEPNRPIEMEDTGLKPGRIYEYKCKLLFPDGAKIPAGNNLIIEYTPLESNIVNVDIQNLEFDQDADIIDVRFDIVKNAISTNLDTIKIAAASQNITEYEDDIKAQKHRLQDLFFTRVVRQNLTSGESEDFGIVEQDTFSDKDLGPVKNVSELAAGGSYKYAVIVYSRAAETLIPEFTRTINSGSFDEYTLVPSKYRHPVTLSEEGSIVTEASLARNHAESPFTQGKVVDIKYVNVNLGNLLPKVQLAKAEVVNSTRTLLTWRVKGDPTLIDHFLIILEINGMRTIVGKSHAVGGRNSFQFIDVLDNGEHGRLEYFITPVYYDYSRGTESRLKPISI